MTPNGEILGAEVFMSRAVKLGNYRVELGCKADRVELLPDGTLEILDYKTNGDGEVLSADALANDLPSFLYYALARICYPNHSRVVISQLNLRSLKKTLVNYTDEQRTANKQALSELVTEIESGKFEARPNGYCAWCSVRKYCPFFGPDADLDAVI